MDLIKEFTEKELITVTVPKDFFERVGEEYKQMKLICDKFSADQKDLEKELEFYKNTSFESQLSCSKKVIKGLKDRCLKLEKQVDHFKGTNTYLISRCSDLEFELQDLLEDVKILKQMNNTFKGECPF